MVELPVLQGEEQAGERLQPDEPVEGEGCSGVVGAVVEGRDLVVFPGTVARLEIFPPRVIQSTDGFTEVSEVVRRAQVQLVAVVVGDDPGEHGVLVQVGDVKA